MVGHPVLDVAGADTDDGTLARPVEGDGMKYALMYRLGLTPWEHYAEVAQASIAEKLTRESADRSNRPLGRALDVGCGRGVHSAALARMGWDVVGIDMVPRAVEAANRTGLQGVRFEVADATKLPQAGLGHFDFFLDVGLEDRHLELVGPVIVLVIDEQHADEFLADINLGGIVLLRARHDADFWVAEQALEISVELPDFRNVHGVSPTEQ